MTTPLITVDDITVRLRQRWLLGGSSWRINTGEQWAVIGPNGAGKTTLAKAIAGLLPVVQGKIHYHTFDGMAPMDAIAYVASDARRDLWRRESQLNHARGFAGRFSDTTTVRQLLDLHHKDRLPPIEWHTRLAEIAEHFGLKKLLDKPALAISTGEMSRVQIARELIRCPKMLILDEPFEGLDQPGREELIALLDGLAVSGLPMVLITHRPEEMLGATTHVLALDDGRIVSTGPVDRLPHSFFPSTMMASRQIDRHRQNPPPGHRQNRRRYPSEPLIDMRAVTVRYGDMIVLDRFSWTVGAGEHWAITGPNGAGKSTLLKLITGENLQVHANQVRLFGKDRGAGQTLWEVREKLGVVSHDLAISYQKQMSAMDVVCSGFFDSVGLYRRCDAAQIRTAAGWLARMGMSALSRIPFNQLSQGQRQMILIVRAMVKLPQLLILDEPCAGLDPVNRQRVLDLVVRIARKGATGLIFVSHHDNEIPECTTHRLMMDRGSAVLCGPVEK